MRMTNFSFYTCDINTSRQCKLVSVSIWLLFSENQGMPEEKRAKKTSSITMANDSKITNTTTCKNEKSLTKHQKKYFPDIKLIPNSKQLCQTCKVTIHIFKLVTEKIDNQKII